MKIEFGSRKEYRQAYGTPEPGKFALEAEPPKTPYWHHCREQFANSFDESVEGFYFSHEPGRSEDVAGFVAKTEEILNIEQMCGGYKLSSFNRTEKDTILWIRVSRFWSPCEMRRSLFTVLLRASLQYSVAHDNYERALFTEPKYVIPTKLAVMRFLYGFTKYIGSERSSTFYKRGWVSTFNTLDEKAIRKALVLPDGEEREIYLIGLDTLWA